MTNTKSIYHFENAVAAMNFYLKGGRGWYFMPKNEVRLNFENIFTELIEAVIEADKEFYIDSIVGFYSDWHEGKSVQEDLSLLIKEIHFVVFLKQESKSA